MRALCHNTRQANWWEKYKDPAIRAKWKEEAATQTGSYECRPLKEDEIDYVLDELEGYATVRDPETGIEVNKHFPPLSLPLTGYMIGILLSPSLAVRQSNRIKPPRIPNILCRPSRKCP